MQCNMLINKCNSGSTSVVRPREHMLIKSSETNYYMNLNVCDSAELITSGQFQVVISEYVSVTNINNTDFNTWW